MSGGVADGEEDERIGIGWIDLGSAAQGPDTCRDAVAAFLAEHGRGF
jgi:hypothetical protein